LNGLGVAISDNLRLKADAWFAKQLHCASSMEELAKALDKGGFVKVPLCSVKMDGKACAEKIKAETVGDVRGTRFGGKDKPVHSAVCVACGKPADEVVFVARQY